MSIAERNQYSLPWLFNHATITTLKDALTPVGAHTLTTNTNWESAGLAILMPVIVPRRVVVTKLGWFNGTAVSGNVDAGIYTGGGGNDDITRRIVSTGTTAQSGTSAWQVVDITDTAIGPGVYYFAIGHSGTGRIAYVNASGVRNTLLGMRSRSSSIELPATISDTGGEYVGARIPLMVAVLDTRIM